MTRPKKPHGIPDLPQPIEWRGDGVRFIDQTRLPLEEVYVETADYRVIATAIKMLQVRGAPTLGVAGAYGVALGGLAIKSRTREVFLKKLDGVCKDLAGTRPTARDLFWAIERMQKVAKGASRVSPSSFAFSPQGRRNAPSSPFGRTNDVAGIQLRLVAEAISIHEAQVGYSARMARQGARLLKEGSRVLTHCDTGPLAAPGYGTALGAVIWAFQHGKNVRVIADETRPLLQGARLTAWECQKAGVPVTVITDGMAGWLMKRGEIDCVMVGADRIAANGDAANKIGTYAVAVLAREHGIPFYVVAPTSTIDLRMKTGDEIPIEERSGGEVTQFRGVRVAPEGVAAVNPAFDVTPSRLITAIVTERGIIREPYARSLKRACGNNRG